MTAPGEHITCREAERLMARAAVAGDLNDAADLSKLESHLQQ